MTDARTEARWDHDRDLRKHDAPTALDRIMADMPGRLALAKLVGYCEGICKSGILGDDVTFQFRQFINDVVVTHNVPSKSERADA